jgi:hypothetical protein
MIEIPTPYWITNEHGATVINPAVLEAQRRSFYDQRMAYEKNKTVGVYNLDGTVRRFAHI